jgi:macrodomain Ter protein organizer (MatP/YcbG family)
MKRIIIVTAFLLSLNSYSQQVQGQAVKTNVNITKQRELVLKPESKTINVPLVTDLTNYKNIVLSVEGWSRKANEKDIRNALKQSIFIVEKKDFKKGKTKMKDDTLYFFWNRSNDNDDRTTTIIVRDYKMKVLYSASHTNVGRAEMLAFILSI